MELKSILRVIAKNRLLFLLGAVGLLLLLFAGKDAAATPTASPLEGAEEYRLTLQSEIAALCESVKGTGSARVLLTLATGEIAVYEKNVSGDSETVALSGGDALLLCYRTPEIAGVSVVCTGGGDPAVQRELTALLCRALDLPSNAVHIAPLK